MDALQALPEALRRAVRAYLEARLPSWETLPDGTRLEAVYVLLQAQEHRRPLYREGEPPRPGMPEPLGPEAEAADLRVPFWEGEPEVSGPEGREGRQPLREKASPPPPPVELAQALQEAPTW